MVTLLLKKRADIDAKDYVSLSTFVCILFYKHLYLYANLISCLMSAFIQNNATALMCASEKGHLEVVTLLLKKGAYIEAKSIVSLSIFVYIVLNK